VLFPALTDWPVWVFSIGTVVAVCLSLGGPDGDGGVLPGVVPAGVLDGRTGVADVDPASHGHPSPAWIETMMQWINKPSMVVALGLLALGVVLIIVLRPRDRR
jgi:hypothetical protein